MTHVFRIYTEAADGGKQYTANAILAMHAEFDSFTVYHSEGVYDSGSENALVLERIGEAAEIEAVRRVAAVIKRVNKQAAVLVTAHEVESYLV